MQKTRVLSSFTISKQYFLSYYTEIVDATNSVPQYNAANDTVVLSNGSNSTQPTTALWDDVALMVVLAWNLNLQNVLCGICLFS